MATLAKGDQILLGVISHLAAGLEVMNLEVGGAPATLAPPPRPFRRARPADFLAGPLAG